jgi:hypothetical protein
MLSLRWGTLTDIRSYGTGVSDFGLAVPFYRILQLIRR